LQAAAGSDEHAGVHQPRGINRGLGAAQCGCEQIRALGVVPRAVVAADRVVVGDRPAAGDDRGARRVLHLVPLGDLVAAPRGGEHREVRRRPVGIDVREATGDAAGLAEVNFGAARDVNGTVLVLALGTGIGSALFVDGKLVPNTELGHLEFDGMEAEARASGRARMERKLEWSEYVTELNIVLNRMHALLWPDLIVLCGGITADHPNLSDDLTVPTNIKLGALRADAGIVGAAFATTLAQGVWINPTKEAIAK